MRRLIPLCLLLPVAAFAQTNPTPKDVRTVAKDGQTAIPRLALYLNSPALDTRVEVVKQLTDLGGKDSLDPLIAASHDPDPEMQLRAIDGLVNFYLPGYVRQGPAASVVRAGYAIKAKFSDTNDQIIDGFVTVRPEVVAALGKLASGGNGMEVRASACRAIGILRGQAAVPDLTEALRTKDNAVMYEALVAIRKIRDPAAGPKITYLLRDLDDRIQSAAIEDAGLLQAKEGLPALRGIVASPRGSKAERSALGAIAMMPEPVDRAVFQRYLTSKDDRLRAAAVEGLGRIGDAGDRAAIDRVAPGVGFRSDDGGQSGSGRQRPVPLSAQHAEFGRMARDRVGLPGGSGATSGSSRHAPPATRNGHEGRKDPTGADHCGQRGRQRGTVAGQAEPRRGQHGGARGIAGTEISQSPAPLKPRTNWPHETTARCCRHPWHRRTRGPRAVKTGRYDERGRYFAFFCFC